MFDKANKEDLVFDRTTPQQVQLTVIKIKEGIINDTKYILMLPLKLHEFLHTEKEIDDYMKFPFISLKRTTNGDVFVYINNVVIGEGDDFIEMLFKRRITLDQLERKNRIRDVKFTRPEIIHTLNSMMREHFGNEKYSDFLKRLKECYQL